MASKVACSDCPLWSGIPPGTGFEMVKGCSSINKGSGNQDDWCHFETLEAAIVANTHWHPNENPQTLFIELFSNEKYDPVAFRFTLSKDLAKTNVHKLGPGQSCNMTHVGTQIDGIHLWYR
jgi:hypothetical protein